MDLSKHTYLFTVTERIQTDGAVVLLPGISRAKGAPVVKRGDALILRNYRGDLVTTSVSGFMQNRPLSESGEGSATPISILGTFHRSDISIGTEVYLESPGAGHKQPPRDDDRRSAAAVPPAPSDLPLRYPPEWKEGFYYKKPCCPNCGSTELMLMDRLHHRKNIWWATRIGVPWLALTFPVLPLFLLQSAMLMKCDTCGTDFVRRSRHVRVYRFLLVFFVALYAWVIYDLFLS
jgi:hypothetical protein